MSDWKVCEDGFVPLDWADREEPDKNARPDYD